MSDRRRAAPLQVTPVRREGMLWGFTVSFLKDGVSATDVRVAFDEETTLKYEWVGRGAGALGWGGRLRGCCAVTANSWASAKEADPCRGGHLPSPAGYEWVDPRRQLRPGGGR